MANGINKAIGMVFLIVILATLVPVMFGANGFGNDSLFENAPTWLLPLLSIGAGIALVKLLMPSN